jgi:colanic acid/amylovoran biosynthesis glycosyltransferase
MSANPDTASPDTAGADTASADTASPGASRPLRVAFFVNRFPVVSEPFIANAAVGLLGAGHSVDIYALQGAAEEDVRQGSIDAHGLAARAHFPRHPRSFVRRLAAAPRALGGLLRRQGLAGLRALDPVAYGRRALSLRALDEAAAFRAGAYDVLHCHFGTLAAPVLRHRRAGLLRGRVVVHFRGYDITEVVARAGPGLYATTFREADGFVANCRHFADRAVSLGCEPSRISVVPSGIALEGFAFTPRTPPQDGIFRLLTVGRLVEKKGIADVVAALAQVRAHGIDLRLRIIGDGPLRGAIEQQVAALGLGAHVALLGAQPHAVVARELGAAHLFAAPSVTGTDGSEDAAINTLKEAMATGLPVVSTFHGGIPELVVHEVSGLLVAERDPAALAAALRALIAAPACWEEMGRAGRARVEQDHALPVANRKLLDVYRRVLHGTTMEERA